MPAKKVSKEKILQMKKELKELKSETKKQIATLVTSAFGFAAALFWRDAIQALLSQTLGVKPGEGFWLVRIFIALVVTLVAVLITFLISKTLK